MITGALPGPLAAALAEDRARVAAGHLAAACAGWARLPPTGIAPRQLILCLHGWSAGPWQWRPLAEPWAAAGHLVWAPRHPGHGRLDAHGSFTARHLPRLAEVGRYRTHADRLAQVAAACGLPVVLAGLSLGGAMALDLQARHPSGIARLALVAPLLRPAHRRQRWPLALAMRAHHLGLGERVERRAWSWRRLRAWARPGHDHFALGQMLSAIAYARGVDRRLAPPARATPPPALLVTSGADETIDGPYAQRRLRLVVPGLREHHFARREGVPHAMLTPQENPVAASHERLRQLLGAAVGLPGPPPACPPPG